MRKFANLKSELRYILLGQKNTPKFYKGKNNENGFSKKIYSVIVDYDSDSFGLFLQN